GIEASQGVLPIRKLFIGFTLILIAVLLALPYLTDRLSSVRIEVEKEPVVRLYVHGTGEIVRLPLEDYVTGVVAAEMPAEFPAEALKAQAVAARTYILKRLKAGGVANSGHPGADVCDDHRHGQAWISPEEMKKRWGTFNYYRYYYKIRQAVDDTRGLVITYEGQLIDPVYHASCGGKGTENAGEVWKVNVPYLQGVPCPYCADPQPVRVAAIPLEQANRALKTNLAVVPVSGGGRKGSPAPAMQVLEYTGAGRPKTVQLGEKTYAATVVRDLLDLRSADFNLKVNGGQVEVTTRGYGHAVGMCQYGAKGLARHGYDFQQILKHYYTGVEITRLGQK
ncbi:MAG: stage II sporulation protein D, partial [Bacillota bacterium]